MSRRIEIGIAVAGGHAVRVTTRYNGFRPKLLGQEPVIPLKYIMWDTWGFESGDGNYRNQEFQQMLGGSMLNGASLQWNFLLFLGILWPRKHPIDVVLFNLPMEDGSVG